MFVEIFQSAVYVELQYLYTYEYVLVCIWWRVWRGGGPLGVRMCVIITSEMSVWSSFLSLKSLNPYTLGSVYSRFTDNPEWQCPYSVYCSKYSAYCIHLHILYMPKNTEKTGVNIMAKVNIYQNNKLIESLLKKMLKHLCDAGSC